MIKALVNADPEAVDGILKNEIGCIVTVDEHKRLHRFDDEYGWERYSKAGIIVMDTSEHPPKLANSN